MKISFKIFFYSIIIFLLQNCSLKDQNSVSVANLSCEYLENPIGLDLTTPRLSWILHASANNIKQSAYQILASTNRQLLQNDDFDLWNTGKVSNDQSIHIKYNGKKLESGMRIYWKVKIWDGNDQPTAWSKTAFWEMSLLNKTDWIAKWISTSKFRSSNSLNLNAPYFRKDIHIDKEIKSARIYVTGLGYYESYLNGRKIGDHVLSPNQTNYDKRYDVKLSDKRVGNMHTSVMYETFDIKPLLHKGENTVGILLGNGWYIQADRLEEASLWYDTPRTIAQIVVDYIDGERQTIITDSSWKTNSSPIIHNGLHTGEIYDARLEINGWNQPDFDNKSWINAIEVRAPEGRLKSQISPPDRVTKIITPTKITLLDNNIYRYDLGQMISGWARIKVKGSRGAKIKMRFIEDIGPTYGQTDTYILKGDGEETWEPRFTWHAFRYVEVTSEQIEMKIENLKGVVVNTDVSGGGTFSSSNKLFNQILNNYQWTQLGNMHGGIPSDCPHRERRGYTGDGQIACASSIYNFDMAQFYTKWLEDIRESQNEKTGYVPNTAPFQDGGGGTAWGSAYIIIPWNMYLFYGDKKILARHYEGMKHWVDYLQNELDENGILIDQGLGEWVPPEIVELPPAFVNTCYYYYCTSLMTKIAGVLGKKEDASFFKSLNDDTKKVINTNFLNKEKSMYSTGRQGADAFALGFGIVSETDKNSVFKHLTNHVLTKANLHFDTGILATPLLLDVLSDFGRGDLAYTLMNQRTFPSFGHMIENNATTIWETWRGDQSRSHPMFGSVTQWFYKYLSGIQTDIQNPGFKHIIIKPHPLYGLEFANTSYFSPYGKIKSNWHFDDDQFILDVSIPHNTTATVFLPFKDIELVKISSNGRSVLDDIRLLQTEKNIAIYEVGSGIYKFNSPSVKDFIKVPPLPSPFISPRDTLALSGDSIYVNLKTDYPEAIIHFTLDGSEPNKNSSIFREPFLVATNTNIRAKTFHLKTSPSMETFSQINFIDPNINGLNYHYYQAAWTKLPDFNKYKSLSQGSVFQFRLENINPKADEFGIVYFGSIVIKEEGRYTFYISSNDGSKLFINDKLIVNHDGLHGADEEKHGDIRLEKGVYPIKLDYFQAGGGMFLKVSYSGPGIAKCEIPGLVLTKK